MSDTYFCFSDECGDYKPNMTDKQKKIHPFYVRSTLIINAGEWKSLNSKFRDLKHKYGIEYHQEIKWAYLWSLRNFQKYGKEIPQNHELKSLEKIEYHKLIDFVEEALCLLQGITEKKIIITYTKNSTTPRINEKSILCFHLQEHMQRIEMELQVDNGNLGILFFDPISHEKNEMFRQIYFELIEKGDFIDRYKFLKDSLNIENSHQSVGIQIADYISGTFSSILKAKEVKDYERGIKMFYNHVYPFLRRNSSKNPQGYGIREVPLNSTTREWLINKMNEQKRTI